MNTLHDTITRDEVEQMREWLKDCYEDEYDQELINQSSDNIIIKSIKREYDGGLDAFLDTIRPSKCHDMEMINF